MLFVALFTTRGGGTFQEGTARRLQWQVPEGVNVLAEYWLETEAPRVVVIFEAQIEVFPAVTGEQGMEMARQAMSGEG